VNRLDRLAATVVRLWTRLYTAGLPDVTREIRVHEIESDLWESTHDPTRAPLRAPHVVGRMLLGLGDDLRWRAARASRRGLAVGASMAGVLVLLSWFYLAFLAPRTLPPPRGTPMRFVSEGPTLPPPTPAPPAAPRR
jgi:hypothetical protein